MSSTEPPVHFYWIGFNDIAVENQWVWSDGAPPDWTGWSPDNPNNLGNEDCAVLTFPTTGGGWNDFACGATGDSGGWDYGFLCAWRRD